MKKLVFLMLLSTVMVMAMTSCKKSNSTVMLEGGSGKSVRVGLVSSSSGFGDGAFNDLALRGVDRAVADMGVRYDRISIKAVGDIELSLRDMASTGDYDLIICNTFEATEALRIVRDEYPEQKFVIIDTALDGPNVASYMTKDEEGSFMIGAMAALMKEDGYSQTSMIGFIGGADRPNIRIFYSGYAAGAKYINKDIQIFDDYVGSFTDVTTAKEIASTMNSRGADMIFHAAGMSGNGLFQAARENNTYAFGVNINQNSVDPDRIPASMIKKVDTAAYEAIKSVVNGTFTPGIRVLSMADGGVDIATEGSNIKTSEKTRQRLDEIRVKIASGEIKVPGTAAELDEFIKGL
ncbi:MAG: BMP family ABC transporter substrate-binding protein [Treponema sp.]|jgi:basic membrane protein A|nr:BMP family ABC transporter substrate-binding protein [Treponema sp.]